MARYALVVGITQYDYPYNFPSLTKPATDAEAMARLLEERGSFQKVTRLPECWNNERGCPQVASDRVSSEHLVQALQTFLEEADRGDALIYFSGHGFVAADKLNQRQNRKKGYLVTSDSQIETIAVRGIPFDSLNNLFRDSNLNSLVLLLDCCHAGSYLERDLVEQTLTAFGSQKDYYLIAACRATEKAYEGEPQQANSIFTEALLEGLAQERADRDGQLSCDRLFDYIYKNRKLKNFGQQPIRLGLGGSITLVTYPIENRELVTLNHQNPYQGLRAFESEQSKYFYGREQAVRELLVRLNKNRFLSVIGPSGSGKSSLVKAGLLPQLRSNRISESSKWGIESFTPGKHPLTPLQEIFARQHRRNQPYVLFIDQFEEVFTLCEHEEERRTFLQLITDEATNAERLARVIVALRGDFLDRCAAYPEPAILINSAEPRTYMVTPLSRAELEEAIEKPAALHGVTFERGLVSQILDDVDNQPGALPLLQYALSQLWWVCVENCSSEQPQLAKKGYEEIGGVKGALNETANNLYQTRSPEDQNFIRDLFVHLVQVEEDKVTRRPTSWERLEAIANSSEQAQRVVGLLADCRLLVTDEKNVQVAHEALLSEWKRLANWIEENRDNIRLSRRLEEACREWVEFKNSDEALLTGAVLTVIEEWKQKTNPKLPPLEAEYLKRSIEKRDREIQEQLATERKLREAAEAKAQEAEARAKAEVQKKQIAIGSMFGLTLLAASTLIFGIKAELNKNRAIQALISEPVQLSATNNQIEALITSVQALNKLHELGEENLSVLNPLRAIIDKVQEHNRLIHNAPVKVVNFSPDGKIIASASATGTIQLWSRQGKLLKTISDPLGHQDVVWSLEFSPNGEMFASASSDATIKLWDASGNLLRIIQGHEGSIYNISFSPDNKTIASASGDGTIRLWNTKDGTLIKTLNNTGKTLHVEFSPDGTKLAFGGNDNSIKLWNLENQESIILGRHPNTGKYKGRISFVKFNRPGTSLASSDYDGNIILWNTKDNKITNKIITKDFVNSISISQNSKIIAAANADTTIKLWNLDGTPIKTLQGHRDQVAWVSFLNDGDIKTNTIASASDDKTVRLWRVGDKAIEQKNLLLYTCNFLSDYLESHESVNEKMKETKRICLIYINRKT